MKTAVNKDASRRNRRDTEDGARNARPSDLLIVDDEEDIRTLAARRFRRRGFEVHEAAEVKADRFRENLYYRINVMSLTQPPLRDRAGDIALQIQKFVGPDWNIEPEALAAIEHYK